MKAFVQAASAVALLSAMALPAFADEAAQTFQREFLAGSLSWDQVKAEAVKEGEVQFYYWGGSDALNVWVDSVVAPALAAEGVTLRANRVTGTKDAVDLVIAEAAAGRGVGEGSVDIIWLNGENFYTLSQQGRLFGSFAEGLPNSANFEFSATDPRSQLNLRDFGVGTEGRELPWSSEQYVCAANRDVLPVAETPGTFDELKTYLTANPGKFIYVKPPNYVGNTFVQEVLYALSGQGSAPFQKSAKELGAAEIARLIEPGMEWLKSIEPLLLGGDSGTPRYPEAADGAQALFRNGEINLHCEFGLYAVATNRESGTYPAAAEEIIFPEDAMIGNKSYLAVPDNTPNPAAALVFANYMASVEAQASKLKTIGYPAGVDAWKLNPEDAAAIAEAAPPHFGVTQEELDANIAPDTNASLVDIIEAVWLEYIERKSAEPFAEIVQTAFAALNP